MLNAGAFLIITEIELNVVDNKPKYLNPNKRRTRPETERK